MKTKCLLVSKYPLLLAFTFFLAGCQQKLIPRITTIPNNTPKTQDSVIVSPIPVKGNALTIDLSSYSMDKAIAGLRGNDSYYTQKIRGKVQHFYQSTAFQTKWLEDIGAGPMYHSLISTINDSFLHGLHPEDYAIDQIDEQIRFVYSNPDRKSSDIYDLDIRITGVFFLFTTHLIEGRIRNAGNGNYIWIKENDLEDDVALLTQLTEPEKFSAEIGKLHPEHEQYQKLQAALEHYRALDKMDTGVVPILSSTEKIKPNDIHESVPYIRKRLSLTDMKPDSVMMDSLRYDENLVSAVKWFQDRHGLEPDGVIGAGTIRFLNQSFKQKIDIIELNLERMRWLPSAYGENYITVNIPEYKLRVFEDRKQQLEMKVIVGSETTATPVFSDTLWYIVFSPTWAVPNSIIRDEIIPHLRSDSTHYSGKNYTFYKNGAVIDPASENWKDRSLNSYSYNVVQQPGRDNALGMVKFIMPNKMSIYLHDTPNHRLFSKKYRALSHGCVRLDEPDKLAGLLLKGRNGWDVENINKAMYSNKTQTIYLKKPYRVQIEYRTAWVDERGLVNFRDDVYGHDKRQLALLKQGEKTLVSN